MDYNRVNGTNTKFIYYLFKDFNINCHPSSVTMYEKILLNIFLNIKLIYGFLISLNDYYFIGFYFYQFIRFKDAVKSIRVFINVEGGFRIIKFLFLSEPHLFIY